MTTTTTTKTMPTIKRLTAAVQVVYSADGESCRLECRNCGNRTTSIWRDELGAWAPGFLAYHDGKRDCSVPDYGEG